MRVFAKIGALLRLQTLMLVGFVGVFLLAWAMTSSTTWAQPPRPTLTPPPAPTPTPGEAPSAQPQTSSGYTGPILRGQVLNVVTGEPESGVKVVFTTGGVSVEVVSGENGEYAFEHLGAANGMLNVVPSGSLKPVTVDVGVRPKLGVETVVNLGVSPNGSGAPPLIPTVELVPDYVGAGELLTITVFVKNTLPQVISDAVVTDWLPASVVPVSIRSSTGNPYFSDNLAITELGNLDSGAGALVEIVAQAVGGRTAASALQGKVSFFYRESTAAQARALGQTNGAAPTVLPVTGVGLPVIGLGLIVVVVIVGWIRRRMGRTVTAE